MDTDPDQPDNDQELEGLPVGNELLDVHFHPDGRYQYVNKDTADSGGSDTFHFLGSRE